MTITPQEIENLIRSKMPDAQVLVDDMTGTGDHFEIHVSSAAFRGKTLIEQHRLLHDILAGETDRIHAVKFRTKAL